MVEPIIVPDDDCEPIHVDIDAHHVRGGVDTLSCEPIHCSHAVCIHAADATDLGAPLSCRFHAAAVAVAPTTIATVATTATSHLV
jgi:hypothetical protein